MRVISVTANNLSHALRKYGRERMRNEGYFGNASFAAINKNKLVKIFKNVSAASQYLDQPEINS